jgi:hypothetical protein
MPSETTDAAGLIEELHCGTGEPYDGGGATVVFDVKPYGLEGGHALDRELASEDCLRN